MPRTVTAKYETEGAARNAKEDLIHSGIPAEKVHLETADREVKVIVPEPSEREAQEILRRHEPVEVESHEV